MQVKRVVESEDDEVLKNNQEDTQINRVVTKAKKFIVTESLTNLLTEGHDDCELLTDLIDDFHYFSEQHFHLSFVT